eukprot:934182-Prymnesium_polylepis.1
MRGPLHPEARVSRSLHQIASGSLALLEQRRCIPVEFTVIDLEPSTIDQERPEESNTNHMHTRCSFKHRQKCRARLCCAGERCAAITDQPDFAGRRRVAERSHRLVEGMRATAKADKDGNISCIVLCVGEALVQCVPSRCSKNNVPGWWRRGCRQYGRRRRR